MENTFMVPCCQLESIVPIQLNLASETLIISVPFSVTPLLKDLNKANKITKKKYLGPLRLKMVKNIVLRRF